MAKKNKKANWKKKHETMLKHEAAGKITAEKAKAKKADKKVVVVKGKNLKRMGIIPRDEKLKRFRTEDMQLTMDCEEIIRPQKRRKRFETKEEEEKGRAEEDAEKAAARVAANDGDIDFDALTQTMDSSSSGGLATKQTTATEEWVNKKKKYDWGGSKKFSGFRSKEWKIKNGFTAEEFKEVQYTFL
jgi:hypothetical protein